MATAPSANDLTRQQLDELDALLQRMLTLPGSSPEPNTATPAPVVGWRTNMPAMAPAPAASIAPVSPAVLSAPVSPMPAPELPRPPRASVPPPEPAVPVGWKSPATAPAQPPGTSPTPIIETISYPTRRPARTASVPVAFWPLVALNWTIDLMLGAFGPPGRLARSGFGKNVLGLAGIGLLVYTSAHVVVQQGWLTIPFPLPWPR